MRIGHIDRERSRDGLIMWSLKGRGGVEDEERILFKVNGI